MFFFVGFGYFVQLDYVHLIQFSSFRPADGTFGCISYQARPGNLSFVSANPSISPPWVAHPAYSVSFVHVDTPFRVEFRPRP